MNNNNNFYLRSLLVFIIICSPLLGQSIQELQSLQRLLGQSNRTDVQEGRLSTTFGEQPELNNKTTITSPKFKHNTKKGSWQSIKQYSLWLNETTGDTSVMELYGFIPDTSLAYFGYNIFTQRDSIPFWQNLPAPDNYILGPGDVIEISLWGEAQLNERYTITSDGNIYIERVGLLELSSKTVQEVRNNIENKFKQGFATLRGKYPSSYIEITINATKAINVHFVGEVNIPGIHLVHPFSSIVTGLIQAGGVKNTGSLRNIFIRRNGETISKLDLYDYIINGNINNNFQLRENDVIVVPVRKSTIEIEGAVYRPGIYESIGQETITQLINNSGGLKHNASKQITLKRIQLFDDRSNSSSIVNQFLFNFDQLDAIYAQDGDKIQIHSVSELSNEVEILGQIKKEGTYKYTQDMNLQDLMNLAGGLEDSIFIKTMYLDEVEIIRKDKESYYNNTIVVNLKQLLQQNSLSEIKLKNEDIVIVRANRNLLGINNVIINGEVNHPGVYALSYKNESLQSIIDRAGGTTDRAFKEGIKIVRDTLSVIWDDYTIPLIAGDSVLVSQKSGVVAVTGEVYNSGLIKYSAGRSVNSYIKTAGGLTPDGNRRDILVVYANGDVKPNGKLLFHPKVKEGVTIIVNKKPERQPFSLNEFLRDTASIAASLAMIYYVITN